MSVIKSERLIVKAYVPWKRNVLAVFIFLFLVISLSMTYMLGEKTAGFARLESIQIQGSLRLEIGELKKDNGVLKDRVSILERSQQVNTKAYRDVDGTLRQQQQEILALREELSFYRGIVSPVESSSGLRVEDFNVTKTPVKNVYHYTVVLTQVLKNDTVVRGTIDLAITGMKNAKPHTVSLGAVSVQKLKRHNFKFRYFEKFEGDVVLPSTFTARTVDIVVKPKKGKVIKRSFAWPQFNHLSS